MKPDEKKESTREFVERVKANPSFQASLAAFNEVADKSLPPIARGLDAPKIEGAPWLETRVPVEAIERVLAATSSESRRARLRWAFGLSADDAVLEGLDIWFEKNRELDAHAAIARFAVDHPGVAEEVFAREDAADVMFGFDSPIVRARYLARHYGIEASRFAVSDMRSFVALADAIEVVCITKHPDAYRPGEHLHDKHLLLLLDEEVAPQRPELIQAALAEGERVKRLNDLERRKAKPRRNTAPSSVEIAETAQPLKATHQETAASDASADVVEEVVRALPEGGAHRTTRRLAAVVGAPGVDVPVVPHNTGRGTGWLVIAACALVVGSLVWWFARAEAPTRVVVTSGAAQPQALGNSSSPNAAGPSFVTTGSPSTTGPLGSVAESSAPAPPSVLASSSSADPPLPSSHPIPVHPENSAARPAPTGSAPITTAVVTATASTGLMNPKFR